MVTVGSTEGPSGNMSNADTLLLSWAEPALPTWRSEHKQGHKLLKPSPANQRAGCISQQLLPRQIEEESQLCFSVPLCFPVWPTKDSPWLLSPRGVLPGHKSSTTAVVPSGLHHWAWSDRKPVLGKHHTRAAELILISRREINHWSKTGRDSHVYVHSFQKTH